MTDKYSDFTPDDDFEKKQQERVVANEKSYFF